MGQGKRGAFLSIIHSQYLFQYFSYFRSTSGKGKIGEFWPLFQIFNLASCNSVIQSINSFLFCSHLICIQWQSRNLDLVEGY